MVDGLSATLSHNPLLALVTLFGAGLVTSLTPCIYPMIPITAGILSGATAGQPSRGRTARLTLAYATGLALFYAILGLIAGLSGSLFGTVSASPWARFAIGNLLLVFALAMLDVIPISAPQRLMRWASGLGGGSYPAVFLLGATAGCWRWRSRCRACSGRRTSVCPLARRPLRSLSRTWTASPWTWAPTSVSSRCCSSSGRRGAPSVRRSSPPSRRRTHASAARCDSWRSASV